MSIFRFVSTLLFVFAATVQAADYPQRPIRLVVPYAAGGSTDTVARIVGARLGERLGQQIVVDNRTGANGDIGMTIVAKAPADGYTWCWVTLPTSASAPAFMKKCPMTR